MQKYFVLLLALSCSVIARESEEWVTIIPLPHCKEFTVQYNYKQSGFTIRYKEKKSSSAYTIFPERLDNINNLGVLTDKLVEASYSYCPMKITLTEEDPSGACQLYASNTSPFSNQYAGLIEHLVKHVDKTQKNCKDVLPYIELQTKISQLKDKELINFYRYRSILKPFADSETDKLIDHYKECGGKNGTKTFLTNMILLEAQKACVFPAPPGLLSFKDVKEVAQGIANSYPNMSIMKINKVKDQMTKQVALEMVRKVLKNSIGDLLGPNVDTAQVIESLPSVQKMKSLPADQVMDYSSFVAAPNLPLEVVDRGFPFLMRENLGSMLGDDLSEYERNQIVDSKITPKAKASYDTCVAESKRRLNHGNTQRSVADLVQHGKNLKAEYCQKNPASCKEDVNTCAAGSINFTTMRPDITDQSIIQACVLKSITESIPFILKTMLDGQKESFKEYFDLTDKMSNDIANDAYKKLHACADKKVKKMTKSKQKETFTENIEPLYHLTTDQFKVALTDCAVDIEKDIVGDFVTLVMGHTPAIVDNFKTGETITLHGLKVDKGASNFARDVIASTLPACLAQQEKKIKENPKLKTSAIACRPLIESEAIKRVVSKTLEGTYKEYKLDKKPEVKLMLKEFNNCAEQSIKNGNDAIFNENHSTPIMSAEEADTYLSKNNDLYNCISKAIINTGDIVAGQTIEEMALEAKTPADRLYIRNIKPEVQEIVKACFTENLKKVKNLDAFMEFNDKNGLEKIQQECSDKATMYAMPKITKRSLQETFKENGLEESPKVKLLLSSLDKCTKKNASPSKQRHFIKCITDAITKTSELVAGNTVAQLKKEHGITAEARTRLQEVEDKAIKDANLCFSTELIKIDSLEKFLEINDNGDLERIQKDCTDKITNNVLPAVLPVILDNTFDEYDARDAHKAKMAKLNFSICSLQNEKPLVLCIKKVIKDASGIVVEKVLEQTLKENSDAITDTKFFNKLKPRVVATVQACFDKGLASLKSTDDFLEFNDKSGISKLTDKCTQEATEFALPEILKTETMAQVDGVAETSLVEDTQSVLNLSAKRMQKDFGIELPSNFKGDRFKETIKLAYRTYHKKEPKTATEKFIQYYTKKVQASTLDNIHQSILKRVQKLAKPRYDFSDFFKTMKPDCLNAFYEMNKEHIEEFTKNQDGPSNHDIPQIISKALFDGLSYAKRDGNYPTFLRKIESICKDPKKFNRIDTFFEIKEFSYIYNPIIADKLKQKMNETAVTQCEDGIKEKGIYISPKDLKVICKNGKTSDHEIKKVHGYTNKKDQVLLEFLVKRKNEFIKLNESSIKPDGKFIKELVHYVQTDRKVRSLINPALSGSGKDTDKLISLVTDKIFSDKSKGSYTDRFAHLQLTGAIGLAYDQAKVKVADEVKAKGAIINWYASDKAQKALAKRWNYSHVQKLMDWNRLTKYDRESTVQKVYENAIKPMTISTNNMSTAELKKFEAEKKKKLDDVETHVVDLISNSKTYRGTELQGIYGFRKPVKIYRSFTEQLAEEINEEVSPF